MVNGSHRIVIRPAILHIPVNKGILQSGIRAHVITDTELTDGYRMGTGQPIFNVKLCDGLPKQRIAKGITYRLDVVKFWIRTCD